MKAGVAERQRTAVPVERRAHPRYAVDNDAQLLFVTSGARMPCRIVDLSLTGCRLQMSKQFPVGIYTRVETEFRISGIAFRLGGVVQSIRNRHQVGVRFLDMSTRKKQQVRELIEEIHHAQHPSPPTE